MNLKIMKIKDGLKLFIDYYDDQTEVLVKSIVKSTENSNVYTTVLELVIPWFACELKVAKISVEFTKQSGPC